VQRIFADEAVADDLIASLDAQAADLVVGDPSKAETDVGPLIRPVEVERVGSWVREAVDGGATLVRGGNAITERVYEPTILADPLVDSRIAKQEVFGPVIAVFRTKSTEEAIARANDIDFAFQAAVFTQDIDNAMAAYSGLNASAVMVNDHTAFRTDWMPFTGLGQSGHGVGGMPYTLHDMRTEKMLVLKSPALENF
jgi:acyl-CoA reductase-like NAD-dependent aldehyde dehydrogenase